MLARLSRAAALAGLLVLPGLAWVADAPAADEGQSLDVRRLSAEQRRLLLAGDTIGYPVAETGETELGAGVAMYLPVPLGRVAEAITSPRIVLQDPSITASGPLAPGAAPSALAGYTLTTSEAAEALDALEAAPGSRFNLAPAEIAAFRAAKTARPGADRAALAEAGTAQW
ncbi:MAG: hypothetical protein ACRELW_02500, partial [Candidatus Rokuibacteriota bacterium]